MLLFLLYVSSLFLPILCGDDETEAFRAERNQWLKEEDEISIGGQIKLDRMEVQANEVLRRYKNEEMEEGYNNPGHFWASRHFFYAKEHIRKSEVFQIIKDMPKGASLHLHDMSLVSMEFVLQLTYRPNLYVCLKDNQGNLEPLFKFSRNQPSNSCYKPIQYHRDRNTKFDDFLKEHMTLWIDLKTTSPGRAYPDINKVWSKFENCFTILGPFLTYKPIWEEYLYRGFKEHINDNVQYLEVRTILPTLYDLDGRTYDQLATAGIMVDVVKKFKRHHPDFIGVNFIYAPIRFKTAPMIDEEMRFYLGLRRQYPEFIGFDLVGQEDPGVPLLEYERILMRYKADVKYFFHAGETNWYGMKSDKNLIDAILLNTTRIGHGYAITKHPKVMKEIKNRNIAVEVIPISNQVLKLVEDVRNHPASVLFALGYPVVISSDDPGLWQSEGVSYDFYYAFMAVAGANADLRTLKQLVINSWLYCGLNDSDKELALTSWSRKWETFIEGLV